MKLDVQRRIGQRIATLRQRRAQTQAAVAEECGFTVKYISEIERGKVNVPLTTLCALAGSLRVTASELLLGVDAPLPREFRSVEELVAGRPRQQQAVIVQLLTAIGKMLTPAE